MRGGSGCSYLGGRMHPLSNHDMAKLAPPAGGGEAARHPGGSGAPDRSRWPRRWRRIALHVTARPAIAPRVSQLAAVQPRCPAPPSTSLSWEARGRGSRRPRDRPGLSGAVEAGLFQRACAAALAFAVAALAALLQPPPRGGFVRSNHCGHERGHARQYRRVVVTHARLAGSQSASCNYGLQ